MNKPVQDFIDFDSFRIQKTFQKIKIELEKTNGSVPPIKSDTKQLTPGDKDSLSNIIRSMNEAFGSNLSEDDKLDVE